VQDRASGVYWRNIQHNVGDISILEKNINNILDFAVEIKKPGKNAD
jgi:hypothetical protein